MYIYLYICMIYKYEKYILYMKQNICTYDKFIHPSILNIFIQSSESNACMMP